MNFFDLLLIIILGFLMYKSIESLKEENKEIREKFDELAKLTGNEYLAFKYIDDDFKEKLKKLEKEGNNTQALAMLTKKTKMDLNEAKKYLSQFTNKD